MDTSTAVIVAVVVYLLIMVVLRGRRAPAHGIDLETAGEDAIPRLLVGGHKIAAIKVYRRLHGVGLKEAKEAVERLAATLPRTPQ